MDLWDRLLWLSIGCFIGFVLGYIARALHDIKERVDHVDDVVSDGKPKRTDKGFMRLPIVQDIAILIAVSLTVWASFATAKVNAELKHTLVCITQYNTHQGQALAARNRSSFLGTQSEIKLWAEYGKLYTLVRADPSQIKEAQEKLYQAILDHRRALVEAQSKRNSYPFPHPDVLQECKENS